MGLPINAFSNKGKTVTFTERSAKVSDQSIEALATHIGEGKITDLLSLVVILHMMHL